MEFGIGSSGTGWKPVGSSKPKIQTKLLTLHSKFQTPNSKFEGPVNALPLPGRPCTVMCMLPVLTVALFASPAIQEPSIYRRVITRPDPNNGYDDYVRAADLVKGVGVDECLNWRPERLDELKSAKLAASVKRGDPRTEWTQYDEERLAAEERLRGLDYLGVQRAIAKDYGNALELIRSGNLKKVWEPREKTDVDTTFPEQREFRKIAKLFRAEAYVYFADGDSKKGTADLLDGLTFSRRIGGGNLLEELISNASQQLVLAGFEDHLSQLSEKDAVQVARYADIALAESATYLQALIREREELLRSLDTVLASPETYLMSNPPKPTTQEATVIRYLKALNPIERHTVSDGIKAGIDGDYGKLIAQMGKDESSWQDKVEDLPADPPSVTTPQDAVDALINMLMPNHDRITIGVLRTRAQLRLLDLHARVIAYRWHINRLPSSLKEAATEELIFDPLSKTAFQYELQGTGYRLYSKGIPATGVIELQYRRPANVPKDNDPIPPVFGLGE